VPVPGDDLVKDSECKVEQRQPKYGRSRRTSRAGKRRGNGQGATRNCSVLIDPEDLFASVWKIGFKLLPGFVWHWTLGKQIHNLQRLTTKPAAAVPKQNPRRSRRRMNGETGESLGR